MMFRSSTLLALWSVLALLLAVPLLTLADDDVTSFDVTTGPRTSDCSFSATSQAFFLNGEEAPPLSLYVGTTYTFIAHFSVHDFAITSDATGGGTTNGVMVSLAAGEGTEFTFTPTSVGTLYYVCTLNGHLCMGNTIEVVAFDDTGDSSTGEAGDFSTGAGTADGEDGSTGEGDMNMSSTGEGGDEYSSTGEAEEYSSSGEGGEYYSSTGEGSNSTTGETGDEYSSTGEGGEYSSTGEEYSSTGEDGEYSSTGEGSYNSSTGSPTSEPSTLTGSSTGLTPVTTSSTGAASSGSTGTSGGTFSLPASTTSFDVGTANRRTICAANSATTSGFTINGIVQPTLTLTVGVTYSFKADFTLHHFAIVSNPGGDGSPAAESTALALLVGTSGNVVQFTPTTVGTLYYVCTLSGHFCMGNTISVVAASGGPSFPIPATQNNEAASHFHIMSTLVTIMVCAIAAMFVQKKML